MAHDVFISYSQKNKDTAEAVCGALEKKNIRCWMAPRDILPGREWGEAIVTAISEAKTMILIFSAASNESQQVLREVERAVNKKITIVPFRIENVVPTKSMEYFLYSTHWLDALTSDLPKHIAELTRTVESLVTSFDRDHQAEDSNNVQDNSSKASNAVIADAAGDKARPRDKKSLRIKLLVIAAAILMLASVSFGAYGVWLASSYSRSDGTDAGVLQTNGQYAAADEQNTGAGDITTDEANGTDQTQQSESQLTADGTADTAAGDMGTDTAPAEGGTITAEAGAVSVSGDGADQSEATVKQPADSEAVTIETLQDKGQTAESQSSQEPAPQIADTQGTELKIGDYIRFGTNYGQPLIWRVINIDKDGCPMIMTDKLIGFKCFDAAERENSADDARKTYGSNLWENSNIREWLNSSAKKVSYSTTAPIADNVCYGENSYDTEPGFLAGFTAEEQKLIKAHSHEILLPEAEKDLKEFGTELFASEKRYKMNRIYGNYDNSFGKTVKDKVFLLSIRELKEYVMDRGWEITAAPVPQAESRDESDYEELKNETEDLWSWWLNTPCATTSDRVYYVSYEGYLDYKYAFQGNTCIRPAMYLTGSKMQLNGAGTLEEPYVR